jgi:hypothetical protein
MSHKSIALVADQLASILKSPLYTDFYAANMAEEEGLLKEGTIDGR